MIYDDSIRQFMTERLSFFQQNPERLIISVEKGSLKWSGQGLSHVQKYNLLIELDEFPESLDANIVFAVILDWYQQNQDPLSANSASPIEFESYVLSNYTTTVVITVQVAETVRVQKNNEGDGYLLDSCTINPSITNLTSPFEDNK